MYMSGDMCTYVSAPERPKEGDRHPGFLVTGNCKMSDVGSWNPNQVL